MSDFNSDGLSAGSSSHRNTVDEWGGGFEWERPAWQASGACAGMDPEFWFPGRGESVTKQKAVCATCTVKPECLELGMEEKFGIWGGLSERERRQIRRRRFIKVIAA